MSLEQIIQLGNPPGHEGAPSNTIGHRGRHAQFGVFECDGCGKRRRGYPGAKNEEVQICFMCMLDDPWFQHLHRSKSHRKVRV